MRTAPVAEKAGSIVSNHGVRVALLGVSLFAMPCAFALPIALPNDSGFVSDAVFSPDGTTAYIAATNGSVHVYDLETQSYAAPINVGGELRAIDITADGRTLYVAQGNSLGSQPTEPFGQPGVIGSIDRVDIATGAIARSTYDGVRQEDTPFDVAVTQGSALFTTSFRGSGSVPLREIDPGTGDVAVTRVIGDAFNDRVQQDTFVVPTQNDRFVLLSESNISSHPLALYDSQLDSVVARTDNFSVRQLPSFADGVIALNDTTERVAVLTFDGRGVVLDFNLDFVAEFAVPGDAFFTDYGVAFSADGSLVYVLEPNQDQIIGFRTADFSTAFVQDLAYDIVDEDFDIDFSYKFRNRLEVNPANGALFVNFGTGFAIETPQLRSAATSVPEPATLALALGGLGLLLARTRR